MKAVVLRRIVADAVHARYCGMPPSCGLRDGTTFTCSGMIDPKSLTAICNALIDNGVALAIDSSAGRRIVADGARGMVRGE